MLAANLRALSKDVRSIKEQLVTVSEKRDVAVGDASIVEPKEEKPS
jgi:hypothetical protein